MKIFLEKLDDVRNCCKRYCFSFNRTNRIVKAGLLNGLFNVDEVECFLVRVNNNEILTQSGGNFVLPLDIVDSETFHVGGLDVEQATRKNLELTVEYSCKKRISVAKSGQVTAVDFSKINNHADILDGCKYTLKRRAEGATSSLYPAGTSRNRKRVIRRKVNTMKMSLNYDGESPELTVKKKIYSHR